VNRFRDVVLKNDVKRNRTAQCSDSNLVDIVLLSLQTLSGYLPVFSGAEAVEKHARL